MSDSCLNRVDKCPANKNNGGARQDDQNREERGEPFQIVRSCDYLAEINRPTVRISHASRQEIEWIALLRAGHMNAREEQHVLESIFAPALVAALSLELLWILEGAEASCPKSECPRSCWCDGVTDDEPDVIPAAGR